MQDTGFNKSAPHAGVTNTVKFTGDFSIQRCCELSQKQQLAMFDSPELTIDLSENDKITLAGIQLICATHPSAIDFSNSLKLSRPVPERIAEGAKKAGTPGRVSCRCTDEENSFCM